MQYFYLIMSENVPVKISLQEREAIKFGRTLAKEKEKVGLYRQSITKTGKPEFVKNLEPYE